MYFLIKKCHKCFHITACFHSERRQNDGCWANISATIFQLSEAVDIETVCRTAAHRREICTWIIRVVTSITAPIHISVVRIKTLRCRAHGQLLQVVVRCARTIIHTFHILEDATREDWRIMVEADTLKTAQKKGARYQSTLF